MQHQPENVQWRHPHGMDVLKRLGIVERSEASISEGDDEMDRTIRLTKDDIDAITENSTNGGELVNEDSDDNEFIFDRASLLRGRHSSEDEDRFSSWFNNRRVQNMAESRRVYCCRAFLTALAFFIVGSCISILGPTLGNLQLLTKTASLSSATSVVSANALGAIIGILMCASCNTLLNTFCIMMFALPLCSITTLVVPWCKTLTSVTMIIMLQGAAVGFVERSCYTIFHAYWRRRHSMLVLFYVAFALGATISPLITSSFFVMNQQNGSTNGMNLVNGSSLSLIRDSRDSGFPNDTTNSTSVPCNSTVQNCTAPSTNGTNLTVASTAKPPKKPLVSDITNKDRAETHTEYKIKVNQEAAAAASSKAPGSGNGTASPVAAKPVANVSFAVSVASTTPTTTSTTTTTTTTTTVTSTVTHSTTTTVAENASTGHPASAASTEEPSFGEETWSRMKKEFARMESYQLAYVVVGSMSIVLTLLYAFVCCFTPCHRQGTSVAVGGVATDHKFYLTALWKSRNNFYAIWSSAAFVFVIVGLEATLSTLLTVYGVIANLSRPHSAIAATSAFWFCACLARIVATSFPGRLMQTVPTSSCLGVALFATGVAVVFNYWTIIWLVAAVLGCCYGCLYPLTYCWLDQQLVPGPWFATIWCVSGQLARLVVPFVVSVAMVRHSPKDFLFALLLVALASCVVYVLMRSTVREAARLINVEQQQRVASKIKFGGGDSLFEYHHFNNADRDVDDEITYFDRSRDTTANGNGTAPLFELNPRKFNSRH